MSDGLTPTRRTYLGSILAASSISLSGCAADILGDTVKKNEYTEVKDVQLRTTPEGYNNNNPNAVIVSEDLQKEHNIEPRQQVRLRIQATGVEQWRLRPALYTTKPEPDITSSAENTVWLSKQGMEQISAKPGMVVTLIPFATNPNYETRESAESNNEFIEQSIAKSNDVLACASAGGDIYKNTELQAIHLSREAKQSSWVAVGYDDRGNAHERWYVPPTLINPTSYNNIRFLLNKYSYGTAVNFLGFPDNKTETIYLGGLVSSDLLTALSKQIQKQFKNTSANVNVIVQSSGEWSATGTQNIVNQFSNNNGIQIVQSSDIHTNHWKKVANAVITTLEKHGESSGGGIFADE